MPVYEYACTSCDHSFKETRSIHDPSPEHLCEKCGYRMRQVLGTPAIQFKGSGFYNTDNRK